MCLSWKTTQDGNNNLETMKDSQAISQSAVSLCVSQLGRGGAMRVLKRHGHAGTVTVSYIVPDPLKTDVRAHCSPAQTHKWLWAH